MLEPVVVVIIVILLLLLLLLRFLTVHLGVLAPHVILKQMHANFHVFSRNTVFAEATLLVNFTLIIIIISVAPPPAAQSIRSRYM